MKKYIYALFAGILYAVFSMAQVPLNKVLNSPENGPKLHQAYLTISFDKGYSFYTNGGTLTAQITNPTVGDILYQNAIDPAAYSINTALPVKTLNENIEVNGALNYSVDFEVPNGAGGLQPSLGVNYSSSFIDGVLGMGFNIAGLSSIDRINKTIYHDGSSTAIAGTLNDAYSLDGKRILLSTGTYGTAGSTYGTELEEFSKIVAVGSSGTNQGPQSFLVYTKSGLIMEYGSSTDSCAIRSGTTVLSWKLKKITDRFNNTVVYSYFEYDDEKPICLISYNGGAAQIKFQYKQRTDKSNYVYGGKEFVRNILLERIEMANNGLLFKKYEFNYMNDNCSKLIKITERSSAEQLMNPTVFSWTKQTDIFGQTTHYSNSNNERYFQGDFNGDGRTDFVTTPIPPTGFYTSTDKWKLYLANSAGNMIYTSEGFLNAGTYDFMVADFNADGLSDMIVKKPVAAKEDFYFYQCTGNGFNVSYKSVNADVPGVWTIVDHNGDGLMEILVRYNINNGLKAYDMYSYTGTSYYSLYDNNTLNTLGDVTGTLSRTGSNFIIDFNGDRRSDILSLYDTGYKLFEFNGKYLTQTYSQNILTKHNAIYLGDFNGDGTTDIVKTSGPVNPVWSLLTLNKVGFVEKIISGFPSFDLHMDNNKCIAEDFNGDGKMDIILWGKGQNLSNNANRINLAINKGNGYDYAINEYTSAVSFNLDTTQYEKIFHLGDYNGDGRQELFYKYTSTSKLYSFATGTPSNLLKTIINGNEAKTVVNYLPMTNTSVYTKGSGAAYPLIDLGTPIQLVSSVVSDNGTVTTPTTTTTYTYSGAKAHLQGKGFLGFSKLTAVNGASGVSTETNIDFDFTYFYPKISSVINKKGSTQLSIDSYIWDRQIVLNKRIYPFIKSTTNYNNLTGQNIYTEYFYYPASTCGNLEKIKTWYYGGSHTKETVFTYNNELTASYLIGRPTTIDETYIRDGFTTTKKITRTYKTTSNAVETETYNPGDASSWVLTREYDTWGNVKKETRSATGIASQTTEFTFDTSTGVNLEKVKNTNLGLETIYTWYSATGLLKDETDPFGNKITYAYDNSDQLYTVTPTTGVTKTITRSYNISGGPSLARFYIQESGTDSTVVKTWFDKTGKDIRNETKGFSGTMIKTDKVYLASGLLQKFSEPTTGTPSYWNTYGYYSADNRLNTFTPKYGPVESFSYSSAVTAKTLNGRQYKTTLNNDNSVASNEDPAGTISYTYWPDGTLKSTTTPEALTTSMTYDKNGNRLTITDPSAGTITDTWYGMGQQKTSTNANEKLTTWYYQTNGLLDSMVTDGLTTDYTYNSKNQLYIISSPGAVTRTYNYYTNGALQTITESIGGVSNTIAFEYDSYGRLYKKTYNWADIEQYYFQNGYLYRITFNGSTVWQATTIDEYSRIKAATVGTTAASWTYNTTTNLLSQISGTGVQQYEYDFNGATRNLNWRKNTLLNKTEFFAYDTGNLDRLTNVTFGSLVQDIGYDPTIKGNITSKTDAGTYSYDPTRKYAVQTITNGLNISTTPQSIVYNAFNKVQTITEGTKTADFVYNADRQRIRMTLKTSGTTTKTRYYFGSSCEREVVGSTTTQYIWIGGDAYTAVAVATKVGTGSWTVYNIFRDHLGTITHLKTGSTITEYSFDAWGRRRDKDDWSYTLTGEPALFADRGFTSHEFLSDFNLYNMNGRLYDPVVGRFLSPDPYIQDPLFSQSYNRYAYALNNPLKFTDPSGEINWPAIWLGNWIFGGMNNWINGGMPFKQAFSFRNNPMVASVNYHPGNNSWSNTQANSQNFVKYESIANMNISADLESIRQTYGTISAYQPDFFDRWSEGSGLVSQLSYGIADGIAVTVQSLFLGSESQHLNGTQAVGNERVDAFATTAPMIVGGFSSLSVATKGITQTTTSGVNLADDAFVHVTPTKFANNILKNGLDPVYSGGKSYVTRWGSVKNVSNSSDFNTILYRQNLWKSTTGRFDGGVTILHINAKPVFFSPRTNWVNGVPQYIFTSPVPPKYITPIISY